MVMRNIRGAGRCRWMDGWLDGLDQRCLRRRLAHRFIYIYTSEYEHILHTE